MPADPGNGVDFERVLALFLGPHSQELYERHISAIERLCKATATSGFAIKDLPKVQQILELTLKLLGNGMQEFLEPVVDLIKCVEWTRFDLHVTCFAKSVPRPCRTLSKPFIKKTSTDEFRLLGNIANILACLGTALTSKLPVPVQLAVCDVSLPASLACMRLRAIEYMQGGGACPSVHGIHSFLQIVA